MELKELLDFIEIQDGKLKRYYNIDPEKQILARAVKLSEEVGELASEVLSHTSLQRKDKLDEYDISKVSSEFADVVITAMLLVKAMGVDIESALEEKIAKIKKRFEGV